MRLTIHKLNKSVYNKKAVRHSAKASGEITPEYLGVGYIIGPKIAGTLVAGGVLLWLVFHPLPATLIPNQNIIASQLVKLGYLQDLKASGGPGNWNPLTHHFEDTSDAIYRAYVRQTGVGTVAAGGFITLLKTIPTVASSFKESVSFFKEKKSGETVARTDKDLPISVVLIGSIALIVLMALIQVIPGNSVLSKLIGVICFLIMAVMLFRIAVKKDKEVII